MLYGTLASRTALAGAREVGDLDVNMPNTLEDAFVGRHGSLELFGAARYDNWRRGGDSVRFFPRLQYVPVERLQLALNLPYTVGLDSRRDEGEVSFGGLYQVNREAVGWLPVFAASAEAAAPVGPGDRGAAVRLAGIASKTLIPARRSADFTSTPTGSTASTQLRRNDATVTGSPSATASWSRRVRRWSPTSCARARSEASAMPPSSRVACATRSRRV